MWDCPVSNPIGPCRSLRTWRPLKERLPVAGGILLGLGQLGGDQVVEAINYPAVLLAGGQDGLVQSGLSLVPLDGQLGDLVQALLVLGQGGESGVACC